MGLIEQVPELIEEPLSGPEPASRYRAIREDHLYANVPGKIEIDVRGRLLMSLASNYHSASQTTLAALGGRSFVEASVLTTVGVAGLFNKS